MVEYQIPNLPWSESTFKLKFMAFFLSVRSKLLVTVCVRSPCSILLLKSLILTYTSYSVWPRWNFTLVKCIEGYWLGKSQKVLAKLALPGIQNFFLHFVSNKNLIFKQKTAKWGVFFFFKNQLTISYIFWKLKITAIQKCIKKFQYLVFVILDFLDGF